MNLSKFAKLIKGAEQVPSEEHFAILVYEHSSVHVPGDERSRTNPGHGYPAHDVDTSAWAYWAIVPSGVPAKERLAAAVAHMEEDAKKGWGQKTEYRVVEVKPLKVKTSVEIEG